MPINSIVNFDVVLRQLVLIYTACIAFLSCIYIRDTLLHAIVSKILLYRRDYYNLQYTSLGGVY